MNKVLIGASCAVAFLMGASGPVAADDAADDTAMKKYRNYLPEQIVALPEKVRQSEVPMAYLGAANGANSELARHVFGANLNVLMYPGLSDYDVAIRAFQKDLGDEPTGKLTVWQIYQLGQRSELVGMEPPGIPGFFSDGKVDGQANNGYARLEGTLQMLEEKAAYPVNKVKIECDQTEGYCTLDEVDVQYPRDNDWAQSFTILWTDDLQYKITRWTQDVVEADSETSPSAWGKKPCRNTKLQLNFKAKEYYMITTNAGEECEVLGTKFPKLDKPRISKIVDGEKLIGAENAAFYKRRYEVLASEYRNQLTSAVERAKAASTAASTHDKGAEQSSR